MGETCNTYGTRARQYTALVRKKTHGKRLIIWLKREWYDNIKVDIK